MEIRSIDNITVSDKAMDGRPVIAHVLYRLDVGGLENGVVNLLNNLPQDKYRHIVISLTEITHFKDRITNHDVEYISLHKHPGKDLKIYIKLYRLLKKIKPHVVHTRNLPALDAVIPAFLAGIPHIIHSEHGRDTIDIDGSNKKYRFLRRILSPAIERFAALSMDLENWLIKDVGINPNKVVRICNGVDTKRFSPPVTTDLVTTDLVTTNLVTTNIAGFPTEFDGKIIIGTIGRMEEVKDTLILVRAFLCFIEKHPQYREKTRLVLVGNGSLFSSAEKLIEENGIQDLVWMPGARDDVPAILQKIDIFVLPSLAEGISNTILESMASGVPVIATDVGGNRELVDDGETGYIVPASNFEWMADAINKYVENDQLRQQHGKNAVERVQQNFSFAAMVKKYDDLYSGVLEKTQRKTAQRKTTQRKTT